MSSKSSSLAAVRKPDRPESITLSDGSKLGAHACGKWQNRVKGELRYFGAWAKRCNGRLVAVDGYGIEEAKREYELWLHPELATDNGESVWTIGELCNEFRTEKQRQHERGDLSARMLLEYAST